MSVQPEEIRALQNDESREKAWQYSETISVPGNGEWIEIPQGVRGAAVDLVIPSGVGYVEATNSPIADVRDNSAIGTQWDQGVVSGTTQDYVVPVTALRAVSVLGAVTINVRMQ